MGVSKLKAPVWSMSEARLRELGNEILQVVAGKQLESEIARISLEGIQKMLAAAKSRASCEEDAQTRAYAASPDDSRFPMDILSFGYGDPRFGYLPFLYHGQLGT